MKGTQHTLSATARVATATAPTKRDPQAPLRAQQKLRADSPPRDPEMVRAVTHRFEATNTEATCISAY